MSNYSKKDKNQPRQNIDNLVNEENLNETIDSAINNAEVRKELSETEMDEIAGGIISVTAGGIQRD
jgi:hypothetical protein